MGGVKVKILVSLSFPISISKEQDEHDGGS